MLTETELKEKLIAKINETGDSELLNQISRIIDLEIELDEVYKLSPDELNAVNEGINQIDSGMFVTNEQAK